MRTPTIHLNGSNAHGMLDGFFKLIEALQVAEHALQDCAPNGRDFYLQGPNATMAINEATNEHTARLKALIGVREEIEQIAQSVQDQVMLKSA